MLGILRDESQPESRLSLRRIMITVTALTSVYFIFSTLPLILDEQYWFIEYPAGMHYSFGEIQSYVTGDGRDIPGRFSIIKLYVVYAYTLVGIRIAPDLNMSIHAYRFWTDAALLVALFFSLRYFLRQVRVRIEGQSRALSDDFVNRLTVVTALVFGMFANLRWAHNGLIAYTVLTYPPVILSLLFSGAAMAMFRAHVNPSKSSGVTLRLIATSAALAVWANWYYELSTATIATVSAAVLLQFTQSGAPIPRMLALRHLAMYWLMFLAVFLPTRVMLARECATQTCYAGLQLSPRTMPQVFIKNLINPVPFVGARHDIAEGGLLDWLTPVMAVTFALIACAGAYGIFTTLSPWRVQVDLGRTSERIRVVAVVGIVPMVAGVVGALIMSLSERAAYLVHLGTPYRHAPVLWLGYALLASLVLVLFFPSARNLQALVVVGIVSLGSVAVAANYFNIDKLWNTQKGTMTGELYPLLLSTGDTEYGRASRCALAQSIGPDTATGKKFLPLADRYMQWRYGTDFCPTD